MRSACYNERMQLTDNERRLLEAAEMCGQAEFDGSPKCDRVLRFAMRSAGLWSSKAEGALCCSGYEREEVGRLYDDLRGLVRRGLLEGKGNLILPAGPRYTECAVTAAGRKALEAVRTDAKATTD